MTLKTLFEQYKSRPLVKYGLPAILLAGAYHFLLPEDSKLNFGKKVKDDQSMREYGARDNDDTTKNISVTKSTDSKKK